MNNEEIKSILNNIIEGYLKGTLTKDDVQSKIINAFDPEEIYRLDDALEITDCFIALKHLKEVGYETSKKELKYFNECYSGKRVYSLEEKYQFLD